MHHNLPTRVLEPVDLWLNYPHVPLAGAVKFYYLIQNAFYLHQVLILNAEARRKDHYQMMAHHIITIVLMVTSYAYNFTRIGCVIMVLMDCCDIFLPVSVCGKSNNRLVLTRCTLACQDVAIHCAIYPLRCDVYHLLGLLVHHSTHPFCCCHQVTLD